MEEKYDWMDFVVSLVLWCVFFIVGMLLLSVVSCGSNKIVYRQSEKRFLKKVDSLNFKVEPSEVIRYE